MALPRHDRLTPVPEGIAPRLATRLREQRLRTMHELIRVEELEEQMAVARRIATDRLATYDAMLLEVSGQGVLDVGTP